MLNRFMMTQLEIVVPWMVVVANIPVQSNEEDFEANKHGRKDWYDDKRGKDNNLYAWIARDEDYNCNGVVGDYVRKHGVLTTLSEIIDKKIEEFWEHVRTMVEEHEKRLKSEEKKCIIDDFDMMIEKLDMIINRYNSEHKMMQEKVNKQLKSEQKKKKMVIIKTSLFANF
ncbi:hypothetical protein LXL04_017808 [Taraxacum kok-saghyz]